MSRIRQFVPVIIGFLILLTVYGFTRLANLTAIPIFTDEAIYIRWSQIGMQDANWRFISLTDGKQPMFTWIMMVLLRIFQGHDPLFVGRLVSVFAGIGTMIGIWILSMELFRDRRIAWISSILYIILPFTVWYDRMALYDSLVCTFSVWSLYFAVQLARYGRLDTALMLGMIVGAGLLNKSSQFLTIYFLPVTLLVFDWRKEKLGLRLFRWMMLAFVSVLLAELLYSILRLSPFYHMISQKDNVFVFTLSEWLHQPFRFLIGNLRGMFDWLRWYMTLPLFMLAIAPLFSRWPQFRERSLLFLWWLLPFVALANFAKILYPRYILFMVMPLIVLAAYGIVELWKHTSKSILKGVLLLVLLGPSLVISYTIVMSPPNAMIPPADRGQFIDDWPAGGGVREVVSYLKTEAMTKDIRIYTEGTFGLMPYSIEIYLVNNPHVKIAGIWPLSEDMPTRMADDARTYPTFFVMNETQIPPEGWTITRIGEYQKGNSPVHKKLRLYRVSPPIGTTKPQSL